MVWYVCFIPLLDLFDTNLIADQGLGYPLRWRWHSMEPEQHLRERNYQRALPLYRSTPCESRAFKERVLRQLGTEGVELVRGSGFHR